MTHVEDRFGGERRVGTPQEVAMSASAAQAALLEFPWLRAPWSHRRAAEAEPASLEALLAQSWTAPRHASPELVKVLGQLRVEVAQARALRARRRHVDDAVEEDLRMTLATADVTTTDRGWEVVGAL